MRNKISIYNLYYSWWKNIDKNKILTPEAKIKTDQVNKINKVWPMSGWINNKPEIINVIKKENVYFKLILIFFSILNIVARKIIKKGFNNSMGWNLGKKNRSIHLLDPFTSTPINGTKNNDIKIKKKIIKENFNSLIESMFDNKIIIIIPKNI